jgi:hypothetical protein
MTNIPTEEKVPQNKNDLVFDSMMGIVLAVLALGVKSILLAQRALSRWVLAGSTAVIFATLISAPELFKFYGATIIKLSIALHILSFICGAFYTLVDIFFEPSLKNLRNLEMADLINHVSKQIQADAQLKDLENNELWSKIMEKTFEVSAIKSFKPSKLLVFQLIAFTCASLPLIWKVFWKTPL